MGKSDTHVEDVRREVREMVLFRHKKTYQIISGWTDLVGMLTSVDFVETSRSLQKRFSVRASYRIYGYTLFSTWRDVKGLSSSKFWIVWSFLGIPRL